MIHNLHAAFNLTNKAILSIGESDENRQLMIDYNEFDEDLSAEFLADITSMTAAHANKTLEVFFVSSVRFARYSDAYLHLSGSNYVSIEIV